MGYVRTEDDAAPSESAKQDTRTVDLPSKKRLSSSFRDPAGFVVEDEGIFKRVVTKRGLADYLLYRESGLHAELVRDGLVLDHQEEPPEPQETSYAKLLIPEQIRFISYPYEWSFDALKDAALLTLEIQDRTLHHGMSLKDASSYNVQFRGSKPVFIDTLSFEQYRGGPWIAYEQFCRSFLGPLLLMSYRLPDAGKYLKADLDGFPLGDVSKLLPARTYLHGGSLLHVHLHARAVRRKPEGGGMNPMEGKTNLRPLVASLRRAVERIRTPDYPRVWTEYYADGRFYSLEAQESKREGVAELAALAGASLAYDLGANTGLYSKMLAATGATCIAFDSDAGCVNRLYVEERGDPGSRILPLVMDLANPSPALGFGLKTTMSLFERPQADLVLSLALVHHLRVSGNLPFQRIAEFLARLGRWLLIEFVPATDPAVGVLTSRLGDFEDYTPSGFLEAFTKLFDLRRRRPVKATDRMLYLFERRVCST